MLSTIIYLKTCSNKYIIKRQSPIFSSFTKSLLFKQMMWLMPFEWIKYNTNGLRLYFRLKSLSLIHNQTKGRNRCASGPAHQPIRYIYLHHFCTFLKSLWKKQWFVSQVLKQVVNLSCLICMQSKKAHVYYCNIENIYPLKRKQESIFTTNSGKKFFHFLLIILPTKQNQFFLSHFCKCVLDFFLGLHKVTQIIGKVDESLKQFLLLLLL